MVFDVLARYFDDKETQFVVAYIGDEVDLVVVWVKHDGLELRHVVLFVELIFKTSIEIQVKTFLVITHKEDFLSLISWEVPRLLQHINFVLMKNFNLQGPEVKGEDAVNLSENELISLFICLYLKMEFQTCLLKHLDVL